jgi:hypothetical protein
MVAYICHSSYSGGRSRNSTHSRPTLVKFRQKLRDSISKIKYKTKGLKVWLKQYSICLSFDVLELSKIVRDGAWGLIIVIASISSLRIPVVLQRCFSEFWDMGKDFSENIVLIMAKTRGNQKDSSIHLTAVNSWGT